MAMQHRRDPSTAIAALAIGGLLSGCSGGEERAESPKLGQCDTLLGAKNVEAAVKTTGSDVEVGGTLQADVLADRLAREAKQWQESDLQHTRYTGCRMGAFEGDEISGTVDATAVVEEMDCTRPPVIPSALPAAAS
ncbi:hypothetical protein ACIBQ3_23965 [Streptomyces rubiginosohelvolus]|uniref:hypothetical protein n=1 Tax=Streptomyces rubiginosohelvolus TaxID=67362 RepID=UPI0037B9B110